MAGDVLIRVRLKDPARFDPGLVVIDVKRDRPSVRALIGRVAGTSRHGVQALLFPKADGWTTLEAMKWARETFCQEKDLQADETTDAFEPVKKNADLYERLAGLVLKDASGAIRHKAYDVEVKIADRDANEYDIVISSDIVDRDKEMVLPRGLTLTDGSKVPLVAGHGHSDLRKHIGEIRRAVASDHLVTARAKYLAGKGNPEADWAKVLADNGLAAYSIGFIPLEYEDADLSNDGAAKAVRDGRSPIRKYTKWELVEVSQVIVPSNKMALQQLRGVLSDDVYAVVAKSAMPDAPLDPGASDDLTRLIAEFDETRSDLFGRARRIATSRADVMKMFEEAKEMSEVTLTDEEIKAALDEALARKAKHEMPMHDDEDDDVEEELEDEEAKAKEDDEEKDDEAELTDEERLAALNAAKKRKKKALAIAKANGDAQPSAAAQEVVERLAAGHVERINTALTTIGKGTDVLKVMIAESAGPQGAGQGSGNPAMRDPSQVTPAGPAGAAAAPPGPPQKMVVSGEVEVKAAAFVEKMNGWRADLIKDLEELFDTRLKEVGKTMALPPDSAASLSVKELIDAVFSGVKELVDARIQKALADPKAFRRK